MVEKGNSWLRITLKRMSELRDENGTLCDVVLETEDGIRFPVHRAALATVSPYFKALFLSRPSERFYVIPNVTSTVLSGILDYVYKEQMNLSLEDAKKLIPLSDRFQIDGLLQKCFDNIGENINVNTVVGIYNNMENDGNRLNSALESEANRFILQHFEKVVTKSPEYGAEMSFEHLKALLSDDELIVSDEKNVFEAIVKWIEQDRHKRSRHFSDLLRYLRIGTLDRDYINDTIVQNDHFRNEYRKCLSIIHVAERLRPRVPNKILIAIGGWSKGSPTTAFESYDYRQEKWSLLPYNYTSPRAYHETVVVDGLVYMIGGYDGQRHFNTLNCFDPTTKIWSERASMRHRRCYVSATVLDGKIYALGGFDGHNRLNSVECYDRSDNQWTKIQSMNEVRSDASAVTVNGKMYVFGGFTGENVLRSAEVYDPNTEMWTSIREMSSRRSGVSAVVHENRIYVLGGFDGHGRLSSCERYSPLFDQWTSIAPMETHRSNFTCCVLDNEIYVLGGFNGTTTTDLTESYNIEADNWIPRQPMMVDRSALSCCVLEDVPNSKIFFQTTFPIEF